MLKYILYSQETGIHDRHLIKHVPDSLEMIILLFFEVLVYLCLLFDRGRSIESMSSSTPPIDGLPRLTSEISARLSCLVNAARSTSWILSFSLMSAVRWKEQHKMTRLLGRLHRTQQSDYRAILIGMNPGQVKDLGNRPQGNSHNSQGTVQAASVHVQHRWRSTQQLPMCSLSFNNENMNRRKDDWSFPRWAFISSIEARLRDVTLAKRRNTRAPTEETLPSGVSPANDLTRGLAFFFNRNRTSFNCSNNKELKTL